MTKGEIRKLVEWQRVMKTQAQHMPLLRVHGPLDGLFVKTALIVRYLGMP